jgi:hypothetical protein
MSRVYLKNEKTKQNKKHASCSHIRLIYISFVLYTDVFMHTHIPKKLMVVYNFSYVWLDVFNDSNTSSSSSSTY